MARHFTLLGVNDLAVGIDGRIDPETDLLVLELKDGEVKLSLSHALSVIAPAYQIGKPHEGWKADFTPEEKAKLRPIAETLAMIDGNAFFGNDCGERGNRKEWYEQYLPEAHALYESNGGDGGWAGEASFARKFMASKSA